MKDKKKSKVLKESNGLKKISKLLLVVAGLAGFLFIVLLCISGIFLKAKYTKPWDKKYAKSFTDVRVQLISYGLLAASGHNMQPWRIKLDNTDRRVFYLYADSSRFTVEADPYARQLMISQGTFLEYISIGGEQTGLQTNIELFPEGSYEESNLTDSMDSIPVAKVTVTETSPTDNTLFEAMYLPDTNRLAYQTTALTEEEKGKLKEINLDPDLTLEILKDDRNRNKIGEIVMEGIRIESGTERVMKEAERIFHPNEYLKNKYSYGFSVEGQGSSGLRKHLMQGLVTIFPSMNRGKASADLFIKAGQTSVDHTPAFLLINSRDNSRINQVKSGMLYSRVILKAHNLGMVMQPLSQPLEEYPEMKHVYDQIHQEFTKKGDTIQMLVRIGKPTKEAPLSMRQDVRSLIIE